MTLPPLDPSDFSAFFHAVHENDPFPWQARLARQVAETGWPGVLDLPTGTGKTAALDIAVFALALTAGQLPRAAPLRVIYVVDRRTIVDQAYKRAKKIQKALDDSANEIVGRVRERLAQFTRGGRPLLTALLRGGIARDDLWARTPEQPLIAVSTVDQVGSRLLFRGYGVTDEMKPVHAGLLGSDVLYLLDEVHLSRPFQETLAAIASRYRQWADRALPTPFVAVEMSATPGKVTGTTFHLDDEDRQHSGLLPRLRASKRASLVSVAPKNFTKEVAKHVKSMLERSGATIAVVVNRVKSARELHTHLSDVVSDRNIDVHLLTGRMRPFDRDALEGGLLSRIRSGRTRSDGDSPVIIVATQSIEAGADFDFDGLVTECAGLDSLRQRFGRLDRLGTLDGSSRGVIVARTDSLEDDPVYGGSIGCTWEWLKETANNDVVDFGISGLVVPDDAEQRGLLAPKRHAPVLLPSHLDAWVQTSPIPDPDPDIALWLHGPQSGPADVQVIWRADLSESLLQQALAEGERGKAAEVAIGMIESLPPVSGEAMSVPFLAAKRWLMGQPEPESFDVEGARIAEETARDSSGQEPVVRAAVVWLGEESRITSADDLRPGQTIIVPSSYGGVANDNWAPSSSEPVKDVAELAALRQGRRPTLRLHQAVVPPLFGASSGIPDPSAEDSEALDDRSTVLQWLESVSPTSEDQQVRSLLTVLLAAGKRLQVERLPSTAEANSREYFVVTGKRSRRAVADRADERVTTDGSRSSFTGVHVTLAEHLDGVARTASDVAERLGLPGDLVSDLRLAGEWHDGGKADPRFQRWLHGGSEFKAVVQSEPLAKGTARFTSRAALRRAREHAGYPAGSRHELMSVALMESRGDALAARAREWALVQHVVASHHGYCRPLAPWVPDPDPANVGFGRDGIACNASSAHALARLDSGIAERFWLVVRRYGWWGAAWIEAIFRLADHRQSEREQVSKEQSCE